MESLFARRDKRETSRLNSPFPKRAAPRLARTAFMDLLLEGPCLLGSEGHRGLSSGEDHATVGRATVGYGA